MLRQRPRPMLTTECCRWKQGSHLLRTIHPHFSVIIATQYGGYRLKRDLSPKLKIYLSPTSHYLQAQLVLPFSFVHFHFGLRVHNRFKWPARQRKDPLTAPREHKRARLLRLEKPKLEICSLEDPGRPQTGPSSSFSFNPTFCSLGSNPRSCKAAFNILPI
jgi:hypothetical protein